MSSFARLPVGGVLRTFINKNKRQAKNTYFVLHISLQLITFA